MHAPIAMQSLSQKVQELLDELQPKMHKARGQKKKKSTTNYKVNTLCDQLAAQGMLYMPKKNKKNIRSI
jgi:hypothetical protein